MPKKSKEITIRSSAAEYLTYIAAINQHIKNIFDDHALEPDSVIKKYLITAAIGKNYL